MSLKDYGGPIDHNGYKVGYGRAPQDSQFRQGRSGNPKGRPRGAKGGITILKEELLAPVLAEDRGRHVRTTKLHAIATQLVNKAVRGDFPSIHLLFKYGQLDQMPDEREHRSQGLSDELVEELRRLLCAPADQAERTARNNQDENPNSASPLKDGAYAIGYRRPPVHTRFQKGRSGNPAGRPRVSKGVRTSLQQVLDEQATFTENGCQKRGTKRELIFKQIANRAAKGDVRFQRLLLERAPALDLELRNKRAFPRDPVKQARMIYEGMVDDVLGRKP